MKALYTAALALLLAACSATSGNGSSEIYGEVKTGVETVHTKTGN
ncbi:hypothetical protein [Neisseria chenwenguii]|nr:hypothetical protein [Neisseria chenwenguii]